VKQEEEDAILQKNKPGTLARPFVRHRADTDQLRRVIA
jgi:hypothetical protein